MNQIHILTHAAYKDIVKDTITHIPWNTFVRSDVYHHILTIDDEFEEDNYHDEIDSLINIALKLKQTKIPFTVQYVPSGISHPAALHCWLYKDNLSYLETLAGWEDLLITSEELKEMLMTESKEDLVELAEERDQLININWAQQKERYEMAQMKSILE